MKQNLFIIGSVLVGSLLLALYFYWKNGSASEQPVAAVYSPLPNAGPLGPEKGNCACKEATVEPGMALCPPLDGPHYWYFPHFRPYFHGWTRDDTLPSAPFWEHPPLRGDYYYGTSGQNLAVK